MAVIASRATDFAQPVLSPNTGPVTGLVMPDLVAPDLVAPDLVAPGAVPEVMVQLALVMEAGAGGLSGVGSEKALQVVEAVEAVKAWADSISLAAAAAMVTEFETDFVHLAPESPSTWGWTRFVRTCRSAAAREIQVATGLPITQCQRRVWLAACEPERVASVCEAMRRGQVSFARALALTEATADLDAFTAAAIATRILGPLTGPDGAPLPMTAPLSQATFAARLRTQLVRAHGLVGVRPSEPTPRGSRDAGCRQSPTPTGPGCCS